jgi:hypothetical protein
MLQILCDFYIPTIMGTQPKEYSKSASVLGDPMLLSSDGRAMLLL